MTPIRRRVICVLILSFIVTISADLVDDKEVANADASFWIQIIRRTYTIQRSSPEQVNSGDKTPISDIFDDDDDRDIRFILTNRFGTSDPNMILRNFGFNIPIGGASRDNWLFPDGSSEAETYYDNKLLSLSKNLESTTAHKTIESIKNILIKVAYNRDIALKTKNGPFTASKFPLNEFVDAPIENKLKDYINENKDDSDVTNSQPLLIDIDSKPNHSVQVMENQSYHDYDPAMYDDVTINTPSTTERYTSKPIPLTKTLETESHHDYVYDYDYDYDYEITVRPPEMKSDTSEPTASSEKPAAAHSGASSEYGLIRVTGEGEITGGSCPVSTEPMLDDDEVRCKLDFDDIVVCERALVLTSDGDDGLRPILVLKTEYRNLTGLENGSICVSEVKHTLNVAPMDRNFSPVKGNNLTNSTLGSVLAEIIKPFQDMYIQANMNPKVPVGIIDISRSCLEDRTSAECNVTFRRDASAQDDLSHKEAVQKSILLLHMALSPLFTQAVDLSPDYSANQKLKISGFTTRNYPNMLLYWNAMKKLDLSGGELTAISNDYFQEVPHLEVLNLAENKFTTVPEGIHKLKKLRDLDLSRNPIASMNQLSSVLEGLINLHFLDLSEVPVRTMDPLKPALSTIRLRTLKLNQCHLTSLTSKDTKDIFREQTSLETINLSENPIQIISEDLFSELRHLKYLDLSSTNLVHDLRLELPFYSNLDVLDLSKNSLTNINAIISSGKINHLNLFNNNIEGWTDSDIFLSSSMHPISRSRRSAEETPWVRYLNLSYNDIKTFTATMARSLDSLIEVDLGGNPIDCDDCRTKALKNWLNSKGSKPLVLNVGSNEDLMCMAPDIMRHFPVVKRNFDRSECRDKLKTYYWLLLIPVGIIVVLFVAFKVFIYRNRYEVAYLKHLDDTKKENRKKAEALQNKNFENDVYMIFSNDEKEWVHNFLQPRLENSSQRYRVVVPDLTAKDLDSADSDIDNSRHVLLIVSDSLPKTDFCMRCLERANYKILTGNYHNLIFVMLNGVNKDRLPMNIKFLSATHDCVDWPQTSMPDNKQWKALLSFLGGSTNKHWLQLADNKGAL